MNKRILEVSQIWQTYKFVANIGHGGNSDIALVEDKNTHQHFAAKIAWCDPFDSKSDKNYTNEINALIHLNHPGIMRLYDHFDDKHNTFLILQYLPNGSLNEHIIRNGPMNFQNFQFMAQKLVDALKYCHSQRIAHCDLKPANILLNDCSYPVICDFGYALVNPLTNVSHFVGTTMFKPPEIIKKVRYDPFAADIWSLGVVFAFMVCGKSPWKSDYVGELNEKILCAKYTLPSDVDPQIADLISHMLVVSPQERHNINEIANHPIFKVETSLTKELKYMNPIRVASDVDAIRRLRVNYQAIIDPHSQKRKSVAEKLPVPVTVLPLRIARKNRVKSNSTTFTPYLNMPNRD